MANAKSRLYVVGLVLMAAGSGFGAPKGSGTAVDVYWETGGPRRWRWRAAAQRSRTWQKDSRPLP